MANVEIISVADAWQQMQSGGDLLLVCAYDSDEKFQQNHLHGAIPLSEFEAGADQLPKDRLIAFY